jgi:hypothetical protein
LNTDWNAEPNAPSLEIKFSGATTELTFLLNHWVYEAKAGQTATLRFTNCSRWNWDATNDEAWFDGNGRYSRQAPKWGEFYEVLGEERLGGNADWEIISPDVATARHFLFYFRDETLQFIASDWSLRK